MGLVVLVVDGLAFGIAHSQARNRHRLASSRIPLVLDLESSAREGWTTSSSKRDPRFGSNDEPRKPDLGRTSNLQRTDEVGHSDFGGFNCQVHGPKAQTTIPDLADVP
jgi:hypothetical protein